MSQKRYRLFIDEIKENFDRLFARLAQTVANDLYRLDQTQKQIKIRPTIYFVKTTYELDCSFSFFSSQVMDK